MLTGMAEVAASFNSRTVLVEGPMHIEPQPSAFISVVYIDETVDPNCVGQGLRPATISHRPVCSAINRFTDPHVRARDCIFADYN
jgi:hypothetical protein